MKQDVPTSAVKLPEWLPPAIARAARVVIDSETFPIPSELDGETFPLPSERKGAYAEVAHRLASDERMKPIWPRLEKCIPAMVIEGSKLAIGEVMRTKGERLFPDYVYNDQDPKDFVLEGFFWIAVKYMVQAVCPPPPSDVDPLKEGEEHAAQLRAAAEWMSKWCQPLAILCVGEWAG